jgi:PAS domain S-box-containing protein
MSSSANLVQNLPSLVSIVDLHPLTVAPDMLLTEVIASMSQAKGRNCLLPNSEQIARVAAVSSALEISVAARHSSVLVLAKDRLVGIFTERDLVKLTSSQTDLQGVKVGDVMTADLQTLVLSENHTVLTALAIFQQHQIRHLPIVNDLQQIIGIVTPEHIRQILQPVNLLKFRLVSEGMTTQVIHALPTTTILEIAQIMVERHIGSIVIVDGQDRLRPVGIVTERDIVQFQAFGLDLDRLLAQEVMSSPLFCLQPSDSLWSAQQIMQTKNIRRLVITNDCGQLEGILTQSNLLQLLDPLEMLYMVDSLQSQLVDRATELEQTNRELQVEVARREQVEAELRRASQRLEERVVARTAQLTLLTEQLQVKIAEQESSELALEISQQGISDFIENAPIGMHWLDSEGNIVWANQAELDLLGYDRAEYIGQPLMNFHIDRAKIADIFGQLLNDRSIKGCEAQMRRKDGSICDVSIDSNALFKNGKFVHARCFTRDITEQQTALRERQRSETALKKSEARYLALLTTAPVGIYQTDAAGNSLFVNQQCLELLGLPLNEVVGQGWANAIHPDDRESVYARWNSAVQAKQEFASEHRFVTPQGRVHWVLTKAIGIDDEAGTITGYIGTLMDITERKHLERDRERFLAVGSDLQLILGGNGYFHWVSPTFESTLGWTTEEMTSSQWTEFVHPDDINRSVSDATSLFAGQETIACENRYRHKDGSYHWLSWNARSYPGEQSLYAVAVDITERKAAEQKIQQQAALLNVATDAIVVRDLNNQIQFWNNGAESIYGWTATEAIGQKITQLLYADVLPEISIASQTVRQQGAWQGELHKLTKTGKAVIVESRWTLIRDEKGNPTSILSVDTDITEQKSIEQQFLRAQRLESLGSLASGIAHDLNNVLTPILGAAQLLPLTLPSLDERNQRLLNMLVESSNRGSGLVKQILTFARGLDGERMVLQARHILAEIISVARQTFPKSIAIRLNLAHEDLWMVNVHATQIHQVLMNLFVNARDAMPDGGEIVATAENLIIDAAYPKFYLQPPMGAYIKITVTDTGIGMTNETIERIFDPFFTTKETGTGLGLSTVLGIVKVHGGSIDVESEVGRGTCFKIYLPAILPHRGLANDSNQVESLAVAADRSDGKGQLVLVVDDEVAICNIAKESLEEYNYRVMLASDGIEAIDIYAQHHQSIALILVDMMMPNLDTRSTIQALQLINPQVKIVVMSGSDLNLESTLERQQVKALLTKPFTSAELLQTLALIQLE